MDQQISSNFKTCGFEMDAMLETMGGEEISRTGISGNDFLCQTPKPMNSNDRFDPFMVLFNFIDSPYP